MKTTLIFALLLGALCHLSAAGSFLEPDDSYFSSYDFIHKYHTQVRNILLKDATDEPLARMVVLPSFLAEGAVSVEENDGRYIVVQRFTSVPIWENKKPEDIKVGVIEVEIDKETALLIHEIFFLAASQARYPTEKRQGLDGGSFYICAFKPGVGLRAGQVWSPDEKSLLSALISYGTSLQLYLIAKPEERAAFKTRLQFNGRRLLKRLKNNAS